LQSFARGRSAQTGNPASAAHFSRPRFDRGMFRVPVNGHVVRFAFFPPYLEKLATTRDQIETTRSWELTRTVLQALKSECEQNGSSFVLMLIPEKEQVYWPLLEGSFSGTELQRAIDFYCRSSHAPLRLDDIRAHGEAPNALLADFCTKEEIPMLDLTAALQAEVAAGREVYFPDDTHWNALGHATAARQLAKFLKLTP
jgi:acetyltransferase AlgX (SGNH hydrolase-like protein)